ncbi:MULTISPECIES: hypothetical protein [Vibrio]|nr:MULTISPECIES: hypothetical protein [Vibrio]EGR4191454.1 hypothetical protein [Vibrio cholerae]HEQ3588073.1 hypothetical protein [Vibrio harveyi]EHC7289027.1 hypothetical protein [Vibrio parahaemolyticus]EJA7340573.1 hypothetical protein [Vibrio parahaemolyticus]EKF9853526.1 hypothetical protein [Vibrio cholerae]
MLNFLLGRSSFKKKAQVIECIRSFERFNEIENIDEADALLVFKSETQQCWLVFTNLRMYFVIDDSEQSLLKTLWARDKENIVVNGRVNLHLKEERQSKETGRLYFGKMNNSILYTYSLFSNSSPSGVILALANKHFIDQ